VARCFGITRNLHFCGRTGDWSIFCSEHWLQPLVWLVGLVTVLAGIATIKSVWWPSHVDDKVIPVVDLSIGQPFDSSSTIITLKNSGTEPIVDIAANLRCFLLEKDNERPPALFFEGFTSIGNATSWWKIDKIDPGAVRTKDANESLARCLHNMQSLAQSQATFRPTFIFADMILAVDIVYRHEIDRKEYEMSGIARLMKDSKTGEPFLWPLPMSDFYRHLLETVTAPNYRMGSK